MPYIAKRLCRFDKQYIIGETIPDDVIDKARINGLIDMGVITAAFVIPISPSKDINFKLPDGNENDVIYTKSHLKKLNKEKLSDIAKGLNLPVDDNMTNAKLVEAILLESSKAEIKGQVIPHADNMEASTIDPDPSAPPASEIYSKSKLEKLNKESLISIGKEFGLPVDDSMTKGQLVEAILMTNGEAAGEGEKEGE